MTFTPVRALVLLVLVLSAGLASLWLDTQGYWKNVSWTPPAAMSPDITPSAAATTAASTSLAESYASIQARPLFAPDRRPPPPPAPPPPPDPLADIQLYGVFSGSSAGIIARVEGKMRRVKVNDTLGAWTLQQVTGRTATFANGGETRELKLAYAPLGPRTPPATPATPTAAGQTPPGGRAGAAPAGTAAQNGQDEARDKLRRRNELRAAKGLPMIAQ